MNLRTTLFLTALLLAAPAFAQRMICCDSSRNVFEVDLATGTKTQIGQMSSNASTSAGYAYDLFAGKLYLTSTGNDSLYVVDMTSWEAKLIGAFGVGSQVVMHGLEWDLSTSTLYAAGHAGEFYTVDTTTGQATLVGSTGLTSFQNLGYDPTTDTMYLSNSGSDSLYIVDRNTAAVTLLGPLTGPTNPNSLAYDIDTLTMYLADNSTDTLYTLDLATGAATVVGAMGSGNVLGLAYIPGTGRLTRAAHGCGPTTIFVTGNPNVGGVVEFEIGNVTGFPLVGYGISQLGIPFCGCTVGHEWALALFGQTSSFSIPATAFGIDLYVQGMDFLGTGGCANPQLTLTDTITVSIGM